MLCVRWSYEDDLPQPRYVCPKEHPVCCEKKQILCFPPQHNGLIGLAYSRVILAERCNITSLIACRGDEVAGNQTHLF